MLTESQIKTLRELINQKKNVINELHLRQFQSDEIFKKNMEHFNSILRELESEEKRLYGK